MENQRHQLFLLISLRKLGLKFNIDHGIYGSPIQVLGKLNPVEYTKRDCYLTTTEEK